MEETSTFTFQKRNLPTPMASTRDPLTSPTPSHSRTMDPVFGLSPMHGGSTLYDSFELRAMTNQLNKIMLQGLNKSSPTLTTYLESPFYRWRLDNIYKENGKTQKKITRRKLSCRQVGKRSNTTALRGGSEGFLSRLWRKVKQGFLGSLHSDDS